jgi:hypothetical protein
MSIQEIIDLSALKWRWMSERDVNALGALFHDDAVFVHMGATFTKAQELEVLSTGGIEYKKVDIHEVSVPFLDASTAILLNRIDLLAVVGGTEVTNPFVVTEVYVTRTDSWALASLSFTRLLTP